jgi:uncharacterized membrane protein
MLFVKKKFVATKFVIRNHNLKNRQYNDQKEKDKQFATKHYSEKLKKWMLCRFLSFIYAVVNQIKREDGLTPPHIVCLSTIIRQTYIVIVLMFSEFR